MNKILAMAVLTGGIIAVVGYITFFISEWMINKAMRETTEDFAKIKKYNIAKNAGAVMLMVGVFIGIAAISWTLNIAFRREIFK